MVTSVMVGILGIAVGAMMLSVRDLTRLTHDRIAHEEAYHSALSGVALAKSWLMTPQMAGGHVGAYPASKFEAITSGAIELSNHVRVYRDDELYLRKMTAEDILTFFKEHDATLGSDSTALPGQRRILWALGGEDLEGHVAYFANDRMSTPTGSLFTNAENVRSAVSRIRITTPYRKDGIIPPDDLRRVTMVIEAEGVAWSTGVPKRRVVQQKVLLVPEHSKVEPVPCLVGGGPVAPSGSSSMNLHWGTVMAKGDIALLDLEPMVVDPVKPEVSLYAGKKFFGAGLDPDDMPDVGAERWVRYHAAGALYSAAGKYEGMKIFPDTLDGVPVTDYFNQQMNGAFPTFHDPAKAKMKGMYSTMGINSVYDAPADGVLYDPADPSGLRPVGNGALVQYDPEVPRLIDELLENQLDLESWKSFAKANGTYYWYDASGRIPVIRDEAGKAYTLSDLSMWGLVSGTDTSAVPDRCLYIEAAGQTLRIEGNFFWKGMIFVDGNVEFGGINSAQVIRMKNPDQYLADPTGLSTGHDIGPCFMDGMVYATGTITKSGGSCLYGSLVARSGFTGGGCPDIYYNSRLKYQGLFASQVNRPGEDAMAALISGPTAEQQGW